MIHSEPAISSTTMRTPNASGTRLLMLSGPVMMGQTDAYKTGDDPFGVNAAGVLRRLQTNRQSAVYLGMVWPQTR
jgi:hypothetical protein